MFTAFQKTLLTTTKSPLLFRPAVTAVGPSPLFHAFRNFSVSQTVDIEADKAQSSGPIAIKIAAAQPVTPMDLLQAELAKAKSVETPVCFYPKAQPRVHSPSWSMVKKDMHYSKWKLNAVAECIRGGKSVLEAQNILASVDKKGAKFINELLEETVKVGERRGYNSEQMFVRNITVGGSYLMKRPDIKGRGRTGIIKKPVCNMRICLEEKSTAEFFKLTLKGQTPPGLSGILRKMMYQNKADFQHIKSASHMLTSNGRRYRRVQFRRLVLQVQKDYRRRGIRMRTHKIERNMLDRIAADYVQKKEISKRQDLTAKQTERTLHFEKNYKKQ